MQKPIKRRILKFAETENMKNKIKKSGKAFDKNAPKPRMKENPGLIYGISPVLETIGAGSRRVEKILIAEGRQHKRVSEIIAAARRSNIRFQKVPRSKFSDFLDADANHQGVIALVSAADYFDAERLFDEITGKENSLSIILDGVEDPHNLGAILRSAECAGADGVFIPERRAAGLTETVAKSSAGASEYVKISKVTNINRLIDDLKEKNIWVVGAAGDAETDYTDWDWTLPTALVMGGEGHGLHRLTSEKCDRLVKIPLQGKIESLNVSVAAGVILFEAVRQRNNKKL